MVYVEEPYGIADTPKKARQCLDLGANVIIVGDEISSPQLITITFRDDIIKHKNCMHYRIIYACNAF